MNFIPATDGALRAGGIALTVIPAAEVEAVSLTILLDTGLCLGGGSSCSGGVVSASASAPSRVGVW